MYLFAALFATPFALVLATPAPEITLAARSPSHLDMAKFHEFQRRALLVERQAGSLSFCYGQNSICEASINLFDDCSKYNEDENRQPWYKCICENGWVSTSEACGWCDIAYDISHVTGLNELNSEQCTSFSVSIAPVPQSVLAIQASYNSTWTGSLIGGSATKGGGASETGISSNSGGVGVGLSASGGSLESSSATSSSNFFQITQATTRTLNGGESPTSTGPETVTVTTGASQSGSTAANGGSGAPGLSVATGAHFSVFAITLAALFLM